MDTPTGNSYNSVGNERKKFKRCLNEGKNDTILEFKNISESSINSSPHKLDYFSTASTGNTKSCSDEKFDYMGISRNITDSISSLNNEFSNWPKNKRLLDSDIDCLIRNNNKDKDSLLMELRRHDNRIQYQLSKEADKRITELHDILYSSIDLDCGYDADCDADGDIDDDLKSYATNNCCKNNKNNDINTNNSKITDPNIHQDLEMYLDLDDELEERFKDLNLKN